MNRYGSVAGLMAIAVHATAADAQREPPPLTAPAVRAAAAPIVDSMFRERGYDLTAEPGAVFAVAGS